MKFRCAVVDQTHGLIRARGRRPENPQANRSRRHARNPMFRLMVRDLARTAAAEARSRAQRDLVNACNDDDPDVYQAILTRFYADESDRREAQQRLATWLQKTIKHLPLEPA